MQRDIEFEKSVGKKLREIRSNLGWSQKYLADIANMEQNQIQRVENAKNTTSLAIITAIAKALGKQPFELLKIDHQVKVNINLEITKRKNSNRTTRYIKSIATSSMLNSPKSVAEIVQICKLQFNVSVSSSAASAVLKKLTDQKLIKRLPARIKGRFVYLKK
ncbi:MAG: helix-turn-helix transcriptional regulator [Cyclobacteriaceae bacterium]|nr:helix-turn-helix transcriptional regulator [Cyclobacteriaceae bacterium]